mmetsp:Transcript_80437/g.133056  ORF Transcript_80437/g.133056 Transcript_80437/m.133056 type:complete len:152 (+) Transcript_80437:678-1133(+)
MERPAQSRSFEHYPFSTLSSLFTKGIDAVHHCGLLCSSSVTTTANYLTHVEGTNSVIQPNPALLDAMRCDVMILLPTQAPSFRTGQVGWSYVVLGQFQGSDASTSATGRSYWWHLSQRITPVAKPMVLHGWGRAKTLENRKLVKLGPGFLI